ncbi:MAG: serine hydrolase domain-containing protein, partial [Bacteroidota bacterium]
MRTYLFFVLSLLSACQNVSVSDPQKDVATVLAALVQEAVDDSLGDVPGVSLTVIAPEQNLHWSGAAGFADKNEETELNPQHPFRIASVTKTFVAAAIWRLHEMDSLHVDDPIADHISAEHRQILVDDGYDPNQITLRHCLLHTSGLYDYAVSSPAYLEAVSKNAGRRWTRTNQLQFAADFGAPKWEPGGGFHYSDTGYILLGETIESALDSTLAYGLRSLLRFADLGLDNTWLESLEPPPPGVLPQVRRYYGRQDFTNWDNSIDLWGGGGLVSTTPEVATFVQALFTGRVFTEPTTLAAFLDGPHEPLATDGPGYMDYRSGHHALSVYGRPALTHSGFWGTKYLYLPDVRATVVVNYTANLKDRLLKKTVLLLHEL